MRELLKLRHRNKERGKLICVMQMFCKYRIKRLHEDYFYHLRSHLTCNNQIMPGISEVMLCENHLDSKLKWTIMSSTMAHILLLNTSTHNCAALLKTQTACRMPMQDFKIILNYEVE